MTILNGTSGSESLNGVAPDGTIYERIEAGSGDDFIRAAPTYQQVLPSQGNDTIVGGGRTTLLYWDSPSGVAVNFATGTASDGWGTTDHFSGISDVHLTGHNDTVIGSNGNEYISYDPGGDLPDFFGPVIYGMMALHERGRADEKEPIYRRTDRRRAARGR